MNLAQDLAGTNRTLVTMIVVSMGSWLVVAMLVDQRWSEESHLSAVPWLGNSAK